MAVIYIHLTPKTRSAYRKIQILASSAKACPDNPTDWPIAYNSVYKHDEFTLVLRPAKSITPATPSRQPLSTSTLTPLANPASSSKDPSSSTKHLSPTTQRLLPGISTPSSAHTSRHSSCRSSTHGETYPSTQLQIPLQSHVPSPRDSLPPFPSATAPDTVEPTSNKPSSNHLSSNQLKSDQKSNRPQLDNIYRILLHLTHLGFRTDFTRTTDSEIHVIPDGDEKITQPVARAECVYTPQHEAPNKTQDTMYIHDRGDSTWAGQNGRNEDEDEDGEVDKRERRARFEASCWVLGACLLGCCNAICS